MKRLFTMFLFLNCLVFYGQRFEIKSADFDGKRNAIEGEIYVNIEDKSILMNINGREMQINKMTFKKGEVGELFCFKESIDVKQRFKFSPNNERAGDLINITHLMKYTVVQGFSNKRSEFTYYLIKKRN